MKSSEFMFYYGPMGCGKTRKLLEKMYSLKEDGFYPIIIKPFKDKKGGDFIISRDNGSAKVDILVNDSDNIYNIISSYRLKYPVDAILVDEVEFFSDIQIKQLTDIVDYLDIDVFCYGLLTDFKGSLFDGSKSLIENGATLVEMERKCSCGNKKIFNARFIDSSFVLDGEQIAIDGVDASYNPVCRKCYKKLVKKRNYFLDNYKK